jgi:D-proline reductase (dithiol) PrdB
MGDLSEFSLPVRAYLRTYRWRRIDPVPWAPLTKPLRDCTLALVSSAACTTDDMAPFDPSIKGGDTSFRVVAGSVSACDLRETHPSDHFDHSGIDRDRNLAFPIDRLHELVDEGRVGRLNHRHLSFCGAVTAPGRLIKEAAPRAARQMADDGVDVALLVPV